MQRCKAGWPAGLCVAWRYDDRMNLQQLRFVQEAVRRGLNLSEVAKALHTSQPGVSKAILELEHELGVDIFSRHGKRLRSITPAGEQLLKSVEVVLREVGNIKNIAAEHVRQGTGTFSIATTHTQARYVLPGPIARLRQDFPQLSISLHQGTPDQVAQMLLEDVAEIGIATESLTKYPDLVTLPCYDWQHMLIMPKEHPLAGRKKPSLQEVAQEPLITYHPTFTGRTHVDQAFAAAQLKPHVVLEAIDSDVIKTYVRSGLGLGIIAEMAAASDFPDGLVAIPAGHLFGTNTTRIALKRGVYLRNFVYAFAHYLSSKLTQSAIDKAMRA